MLLTLGASAKSTALFASVVHVAKNDTLNVRAQPTAKSEKVAALPPGAVVGVEKCKSIYASTWCRVYPMVQQWYADFSDGNDRGWVNARYLHYSNKGYVLVDGKENCEYVIACKEERCELVTDFALDDKGEVTGIQTEWVERKRLKGESSFGAMNPKEDGYCSTGMFVEDYLKRKHK